MTANIVDVNVAIVANDWRRQLNSQTLSTPQADEKCRLACVEVLKRIIRKEVVVVDAAGDAIREYLRRLRTSGQPGIGDAFLKFVLEQQYAHKRIQRITVKRHADRKYEPFPADPDLKAFDQADRIYVALNRSVPDSRVLNAVDSDYKQHAKALVKHGVTVKELCPGCVKGN